MKQKLIETFDKQIYFEIELELNKHLLKNDVNKDELKEYKDKNKNEITQWKKEIKNLKLCESYLAKEIFLKSINFDIDDWKKIRKGDYYNEISLESGINKKLYKLAKIEEYLNN
jgi:hypothetical protein